MDQRRRLGRETMRGNRLKMRILLACSLGLSLCTTARTSSTARTAPSARAVVQESVEERTIPLRCEVACSETQLRTANATLIWSNAEPTLTASGISRSMMSTPTIDTTVYKGWGSARSLRYVLRCGCDAGRDAGGSCGRCSWSAGL